MNVEGKREKSSLPLRSRAGSFTGMTIDLGVVIGWAGYFFMDLIGDRTPG